MLWIMQLSTSRSRHRLPLLQNPRQQNSAHALTGHTIPKLWNRKSSNGDMYLIHHAREKEERRRKRTREKLSKKVTILEGDGLWREQTHGTTGSGSCLYGMKREQRPIFDWFSYHLASSSIER